MLTFRWRRQDRWQDRLSDDVARSSVHVLRSDADLLWIEQLLTYDVVPTSTAVCLAVGTELTKWKGSRWRRYVHNFLTNHVVVAVVVVQWTPVVGRWVPRLIRYRLTDDIVAETLAEMHIIP